MIAQLFLIDVLMKSTLEDVVEGMMSAPIPVSNLDLGEVNVTRRLASKGRAGERVANQVGGPLHRVHG